MANEESPFPVEEIPNPDAVYMRAYKDRVRDGYASPSAFKPHGGGLSVDWEKYSTPEWTRSRGKNPGDNAIVRMIVGDIRTLADVVHAPLRDNQAHSEVKFSEEEDTKLRFFLSRVATIVLPVDG